MDNRDVERYCRDALFVETRIVVNLMITFLCIFGIETLTWRE